MGNEQKGNIPKKRSTRTEKNKNYFFSSFYLCDRNDQKKSSETITLICRRLCCCLLSRIHPHNNNNKNTVIIEHSHSCGEKEACHNEICTIFIIFIILIWPWSQHAISFGDSLNLPFLPFFCCYPFSSSLVFSTHSRVFFFLSFFFIYETLEEFILEMEV